MTSYVPIEFVHYKYGLICFILNEKSQKEHSKTFQVYLRMILNSDLINYIPISKLKSWFIKLIESYGSIEANFVDENSEILEKLIRKCTQTLTKEKNADSLVDFVDKVNYFRFLSS